jgi:RimJ/RimL family protein N-acetyltransferase
MTGMTFSHSGMMFRMPKSEDLELIADLRNDLSTWEQLTDPRPVGRADQKAWLESLGSRSGKLYFIAYTASEPFVGLIRMDEIDHINRSIRVGADVVAPLRGKGFGKAIYGAVKKYCFDYLNMNRVWLAVLETNKRAISLYKKVGFRKEGRYRAAVFRNGRFIDYVLMSLLEQEYRQ